MANIIEIPKKPEEPTDFEIGAVVTLKSGGVQMTVRRLVRIKSVVMVSVDWMDAADTACDAEYDARQLMIADNRPDE